MAVGASSRSVWQSVDVVSVRFSITMLSMRNSFFHASGDKVSALKGIEGVPSIMSLR
jgi:hypothetical protein